MAALETILYVHSSDELYGADRVLLQLIDGLDSARFRPVVVLPTDVSYSGELTRELEQRGVRTVHLKTAALRRKYFTPPGLPLYLWRFFRSTIALMRIISEENVALVHTNTAAIIPGALAARLSGRPHVWHIHEILVQPRFLRRLTAWMVPRLSERFVAVSGPTRDHLCRGNPAAQAKGIVIHNGFDFSRFESGTQGKRIRQEWRVSPDTALVGMIGRISHWKGQDYFLDVAAHLHKRLPPIIFAIIGSTFPGNEHLLGELQRRAAELGLTDAVVFSPFRADIPDVLAALDVLVLPSTLPDPLPTVVLEAMAAGKPVVANAHGGSTEMVADGETGYLIPPDCPDEMARAIERLIADRAGAREMGTRGRRRVHEQFSLERFVARWSELYEQLLAAHTPNTIQ